MEALSCGIPGEGEIRFNNTSYSFMRSLTVWYANRTVEMIAPICENRQDSVPVSRLWYRLQADEMVQFCGVFKCGGGQLGSFIHLNGIDKRKSRDIHTSRNLVGMG